MTLYLLFFVTTALSSPYVSVQKDTDGTWWFVQNSVRFFSTGVNHVNDGGQDDGVGGRESTECKKRTQNPLCGDTLSFGNILKYAPYHNVTQALYNSGVASDTGGPNPVWAVNSISRIRQWNFNTIGGWSNKVAEQEISKRSDMFYAHLLDIGSTWLNHEGLDYDVFSQDFIDQCNKIAENEVRPRANDTQLLGYQLDNEIILFGGGRLCLDTYLSYPAGSPGVSRALEFLENVYNNINNLNTQWNIFASSFSDVPNHIHDQSLNTDVYTKDSENFLALVAIQYFSVAQNAIRKYDSYHLILGVRGIYLKPSILVQVVKYFDVIDIHDYGDVPDVSYVDEIYATTGVPIYIGEFSFTASDSQLTNTAGARANNPYTTQTERSAAFMRFVLFIIEKPYIIGYHWWQFVDEPTTGRWPDGENSNYGIVHLSDDPYFILTNTMSIINKNANMLHEQKNYGSLLLLQYWSEERQDSFLDPTCFECANGRKKNPSPEILISQNSEELSQNIDGSYIFRSIEGAVSTTISSQFNVTLNLYYNPQRMDNAVCLNSPGTGYIFVRVVGYGIPISGQSQYPTCVLSLFQNKQNGDFLSTCHHDAALQSGYGFLQDLVLLISH